MSFSSSSFSSGNVYEYNDAEWKDKVSKINGDTITYDESGNPLSYRDGMSFTWEHGRQLSSLQTDDNSVNYKYDSNGMRTQKTDNNGTTNYYYDPFTGRFLNADDVSYIGATGTVLSCNTNTKN